MNGKMAKMLHRMRRHNHKSKRLLMSLPHHVRGKIRTLHKTNKLTDTDFLKDVTGQ